MGSTDFDRERQRVITDEFCVSLFAQISDIVVGQEPNVTAREALLRWARRSTARYPGVRVTDFTGSWRDGLAFSALIHRNRPDLVDWRGARASQPRERLDRVFHVAEREYGVTRLLDPEGNSSEIDEDVPLYASASNEEIIACTRIFTKIVTHWGKYSPLNLCRISLEKLLVQGVTCLREFLHVPHVFSCTFFSPHARDTLLDRFLLSLGP